MSRANVSDGISRQRYLEEIIRKERNSMIERYIKSKQRSEAGNDLDEELTKSRQYEVFRKKLERQRLQPTEAQLRLRQMHLELPSIIKDPERMHETASGRDEALPVGSSLPPLVQLQMEPVDVATRKMLYEGLSSEGRGRQSYLRTRNNLDPERKYRYPVLTSWSYGWRLEDTVNAELSRNPIRGRTKVVHETFYRRNGIPELSLHGAV